MIYVHAPDNAISAIAAGVPVASQLFQGFLVEGVGRASAALLSLVSGLLAAVALSRGDAASLYRRRFRSIVLPMLFRSTLAVGLYALLSLAQPTFLSAGGRALPESVPYYANAMLFLSDQPMGPALHPAVARSRGGACCRRRNGAALVHARTGVIGRVRHVPLRAARTPPPATPARRPVGVAAEPPGAGVSSDGSGRRRQGGAAAGDAALETAGDGEHRAPRSIA